MTEAEWLAQDALGPMLAVRAVKRKSSERKLRLWACACCDLVADCMVAEGQQAIRVAERFADGDASSRELAAAHAAVQPYSRPDTPEFPAWVLVRRVVAHVATDIGWAVARSAVQTEAFGADEAEYRMIESRVFAEIGSTIAALLRDVFGNPFCKVTFDAKWRTDTAVALARQMYDSRDFGAMPILADALQDAGCGNEDILSHCRDTAARHARGCWVCDGVLGKA